MSLDQFIACRRRPVLPDDLPAHVVWKLERVGQRESYLYDGGTWLLHVAVEDEAELGPEMLAEAFGDRSPDGACIVAVVLEPVTSNPDAIALQMAVLSNLESKCGGIVLPN
jgi:hypothetical protein